MLDVPDYMHMQGVYETNMYTAAYSSIDDMIKIMSTNTNSQGGDGSFSTTRKKFDKFDATSKSGGFGAGKTAPASSVKGKVYFYLTPMLSEFSAP